MSAGLEYTVGDDLPDGGIWWRSRTGLRDFSTGWTFTAAVIAERGEIPMFSKASGFTGAAGAGTESSGTPNLVIAWATAGELNTLPPGGWLLRITATRTADSKSITRHVPLLLREA